MLNKRRDTRRRLSERIRLLGKIEILFVNHGTSLFRVMPCYSNETIDLHEEHYRAGEWLETKNEVQLAFDNVAD